MSVLEQKIEGVCAPLCAREGVELAEAKLTSHGGQRVLTLYIWSPERPVSLDDCERVHRAVDPALDELDPTGDKPYTLNVSSLGLDRPVVSDGDFRRNLGAEVTARLFAPLAGKKEYDGVLSDFDRETFTLETAEGTLVLERKKAAKIQLKLDF